MAICKAKHFNAAGGHDVRRPSGVNAAAIASAGLVRIEGLLYMLIFGGPKPPGLRATGGKRRRGTKPPAGGQSRWGKK